MQLRKCLEQASNILESNQISYALIGGFSLGAYAIFRATKDIDFLVDLSAKNQIIELFTAAGYQVHFQSQDVLQLTGPGYIDFILAQRPLSRTMLAEAKKNSFLGVPIVSAEGLIGLKIQAYKNDPSRTHQDKADIQNLLKQKNIDLGKVKTYADLFGEWNSIQELIKK